MGKDSEKGKYSSPEGSRTWEYIAAVIGTIGMLPIGTQLGWNSPSIAELREPNSRIFVTTGDISTLASSMSIGHVLGLLASVFILDKFGRKKSILVCTVPMIVSWCMIMFAEHVMVLIVARILSGFSLGVIICASPIYSAEIYSPEMRGPLGAMGVVTFFGGILFMFAVAPLLRIQATAGICMGFTMIFLICFYFVPESPYFLIMVGREDEAESALEKLRGKVDVAGEIELIKATLRERGKVVAKSNETEKEEGRVGEKRQSTLKKLVTIRGNVKALLIGLTLTTLQHLCGITTILSYCHIIFDDMGVGIDTYVASLTFSILQIISALAYILNVKKFKRKTLLLVSGILTVILLTIIATYFFLKEHMNFDVHPYGKIPLYSTFLLVIVLNIGVAALPGMILSEIFSSEVKILGNCIVGLFGSLTSILSTKSYLLMATSWGFGHSIPFFSYAVITTLCIFILMKWLPETKDKTLLEIQRELNA